MWPTRKGRSGVNKAKPFDIPKKAVWEAFQHVKANQGAAGVDGQSIQDFETRLAGNLYKLWNRLSSGSYMPPPVRRVDIPKANGGTRPLGIPTVADRIAQEVVRRTMEPVLEPLFHRDSYGYRPGRSAIQAVRTARERCWRYDWVVDLDIKSFFDGIDWELLLRAVRKHAPNRWVVIYIERWLKAPAMGEDGMLVPREQGTPQGGVISPLLANLFLHYAFDLWMQKTFPGVPFERYADDAIYCKDTNRKREHPVICFDFLGYQFRPRSAKWRAALYGTSFLPGASPKALKAIRQAIRRWSLQTRSDKALDDLARMFNPYIRGWIGYFGHFYKSALYPTIRRIDAYLTRWVRRKCKRFRRRPQAARDWLARVVRSAPDKFAHWSLLYGQRLNAGSRMS